MISQIIATQASAQIASIQRTDGSQAVLQNQNAFNNVREEERQVREVVTDTEEAVFYEPKFDAKEEGKIKNSKGTTVRFNNAIIIMTSNAGFENNCIGFNKSEDNITSLKNRFSTSFINRIDGIMMFNRLNEDDIKKIINIKLDTINKKYSSININYSDDLIMDIINKSDYYNFGARRLDKIISRGIENNIIEAIINNDKEIFIDKLNEYEKNITKA